VQAGSDEFSRLVESVEVGKALFDLRATAVTMHIAESAYVHEYVEAKALTGVEGAEEFVMLAAMAEA